MRRLNLFWNKTRFVHFVQDENRHTRETLYYYQALDAFASTIREVLARIFETVRTLKSKIFQKFLKINNNNNKKKNPEVLYGIECEQMIYDVVKTARLGRTVVVLSKQTTKKH